MTEPPKILAFAGSTRASSLNKRLVKIAAAAAVESGAHVNHLDLRDLPMPLYDGDLEATDGIPKNGLRFKALLKEHDGFLIASPEYNGSFSAVLKNAIDWASRPQSDEPPLVAFRGKAAGLVSASPGALGGLRGLAHLRQLLSNIQVLVIPHQAAIGRAAQAFDDNGGLNDASQLAAVEGIGAGLADLLRKMQN